MNLFIKHINLVDEFSVENIPTITSISDTTLAIDKKGKLVSWGRVFPSYDFTPEIKVVKGLEKQNVIAIGVSSNKRIYLTSENMVYYHNQ